MKEYGAANFIRLVFTATTKKVFVSMGADLFYTSCIYFAIDSCHCSFLRTVQKANG